MVILGLGSNIGDRLGYLQAAVRSLSPLIRDIRVSRVLQSAAMLPDDASQDMDQPFLNMAVSGVTDLTPQALFKEIKSIEKDLGRVIRRIWGPREIDIDILAMGDTVIEAPELTIPHSGVLKRDFVLLPLAEIAPDWRYPVAGAFFGKRAAELVVELGMGFSDQLKDSGLSIHV